MEEVFHMKKHLNVSLTASFQVLLKGNIFFSLISMFSIVMQGHAGDRVELQRRNMEGRGKAYFLGIIVSDLRNGDWLHFEY